MSLLKHVAERAHAIDRDFDCVPRLLHGPDAERRTTSDDVSRHKCHVLREQADELDRRKEHIAYRVVLSLVAIENGPNAQAHGINTRRDYRSEDAKGVKALGAGPLGESRALVDYVRSRHVVHAGVAEDV